MINIDGWKEGLGMGTEAGNWGTGDQSKSGIAWGDIVRI